MRSREEIEKQISMRGDRDRDAFVALELLLDIQQLLQGIKFKSE